MTPLTRLMVTGHRQWSPSQAQGLGTQTIMMATISQVIKAPARAKAPVWAMTAFGFVLSPRNINSLTPEPLPPPVMTVSGVSGILITIPFWLSARHPAWVQPIHLPNDLVNGDQDEWVSLDTPCLSADQEIIKASIRTDPPGIPFNQSPGNNQAHKGCHSQDQDDQAQLAYVMPEQVRSDPPT